MTLFKVSAEKVEATYKRAAIGLDFPILASSAKAPSTEVGVMVLSLSTMRSRAPKTDGPWACLLSKSAWSYSLARASWACLAFKISNWLFIWETLIPRALISDLRTPIYSVASSALAWQVAIYLSRAVMVSAQSCSYWAWRDSDSYY